jgi:hypothetical protein
VNEETTLGEVIDVRRALAVAIHDAWIGYNPHSPIVRTYDLRRTERGGLAGEGRFSTAVAGERVVPVTIGPAATRKFLDAVALARLLPGAYEPFQDHTDDYPHIEVAVHVPAMEMGARSGFALLFTTSQGDFNAPWGACFGGEMWTLPGEEVGRALDGLRRPLKTSTLDRMIRAADRAGPARR